jgi:acyl-coenzyme A thioesterase PaaI-like protein
MAVKYHNWRNRLPSWVTKFMLSYIYGPYIGTGITFKKISPDFKSVEVQMKMRWYNVNYFGSHFGGSLFSMTDPCFAMMVARCLGHEYVVWDKASSIEYKKPGYGTVTAKFAITDEEVAAIKHEADTHDKYIFDRSVDITDQEGATVATVIKSIYVRKRRT